MNAVFVILGVCLLAVASGQQQNQQQFGANQQQFATNQQQQQINAQQVGQNAAQAQANLAAQQAAINSVNQLNAQQQQINAQQDAQNAQLNAQQGQQNAQQSQGQQSQGQQSQGQQGQQGQQGLTAILVQPAQAQQSQFGQQSQGQQGQSQQSQFGQQGQAAQSQQAQQIPGRYIQPTGFRPASSNQITATYGQAQQAQSAQSQQQGQQVLSAVDASRLLIQAAIQQGANPNNFAIQTNARYQIAQQPNPQNPDAFTALDQLRGRQSLTIDEILNILSSAVAGRDYPAYNDIPSTRFSCENVKQAGFYADSEGQCQVIRRCDINGAMWSYLCPNMTLFNQITLVCDWFFNVNCANSIQYYDYSNPRLYTQFALLDTPNQSQARPGRVVYQVART